MRLLGQVEGSVLWFLQSNRSFSADLRKGAGTRGIAPEHLVFAPRLPLGDHLARHRHADLFLDTLYYNAHSTACDALWMGMPVLTCIGTAFADYEQRALELACTPSMLAAVGAKLAANRPVWPLFDTERSARYVEAAYVEMTARHRRGEPPRISAWRRSTDGANEKSASRSSPPQSTGYGRRFYRIDIQLGVRSSAESLDADRSHSGVQRSRCT